MFIYSCKEPTQLEKNKEIVGNSCWYKYKYIRSIYVNDTYVSAWSYTNNDPNINYYFNGSKNTYLTYRFDPYFGDIDDGVYNFLNENQIIMVSNDTGVLPDTLTLKLLNDNEMILINIRQFAWMWSPDTFEVDSYINYFSKITCHEKALEFEFPE